MLNLNGTVVSVIGLAVIILAQFGIIIPDATATAVSAGVIALIGAIYQIYNYRTATGGYGKAAFGGVGASR